MSKVTKLVVANAGIFILYAGALGFSFWLGMTPNDFIKLVPTASASAIANMTTLTIALIAILKGTPSFTFGAPEPDEWSIILPLSINCQGASGVRLERIDAEWMDVSEISEGGSRSAASFPYEVKAGQIAELSVRFNVVKGSQNKICNKRKLSVTCVYIKEGRQTSCEISKSISNVFRRK